MLLSAVLAAEPARTGTLPAPEENDSSSLAAAHEAQRTGVVLPPSEPARNQPPLRGEIILPTENNSGFYIRLGDPIDRNLTVTFSPPQQPPLEVDVPINVTQNVTITNRRNHSVNETINLWNHAGDVEEALLREYERFEILDGNLSFATQPLFTLPLAANETMTLRLEYRYPPVRKTVTCTEQSLADLLPSGAMIRYTELPLDTYISSRCVVDLTHARSSILFTPITVSLADYPQLEGLRGTSGDTEVEVNDLRFEVRP